MKNILRIAVPAQAPRRASRGGGVRSGLLLLGLSLTLVASTAHAREEGAPASALGLGDAVRATATGTSSLYFNPAGMGLVNQYAVEAGYGFSGDYSGHALGASAIDSKTNSALAMGVGYNYILGEEPGGGARDGHSVRAGLASGYAWEGFGFQVGVGGKYLTLDRAGKKDYRYFTMDAGLIVEIANMVRVGVAAQNLIATKADDAPRSIGLGAAVTIDAFQASFDTTLDIETDPSNLFPLYSVGAQYLFAGMIVARAGFSLGGQDGGKHIAAGAGYVSDSIAADASFQKRIDGEGGLLFSLSVRYFLP